MIYSPCAGYRLTHIARVFMIFFVLRITFVSLLMDIDISSIENFWFMFLFSRIHRYAGDVQEGIKISCFHITHFSSSEP